MMLHKHYVGIYQSSVAQGLAKAPVDTVGLREEQGPLCISHGSSCQTLKVI